MIPAETIERAREADLISTAERLGVRLQRVGATWRAGPCPACGGTDRFTVNTRKRKWHCRGCGKGDGDPISLVQHTLKIDFRAAVAFLVGETTIDMAPPPQPQAPSPNAFVERLIADIVRELIPVRGTPGEQYLVEARKIDTEAIADVLRRTDAIGWHPSILFREKGHVLDGRRLGCIIGVMSEAVSGRPTGAISRTYISEGRKLAKARTFGEPAGIVRLSADEDVLEGLAIAEGLETALAAMACGFRPLWSTGSTALMAAFPVLAGVETLTLLADHDPNGAGERAAREAERRWRQAGREARIVMRDIPGDFNDALREAGA